MTKLIFLISFLCNIFIEIFLLIYFDDGYPLFHLLPNPPPSPHGLSFFRKQTNQNKKKRKRQETHTKLKPIKNKTENHEI